MGKRSKFMKIGNSRKNFGDILKVKKEKIKNLLKIANKINPEFSNKTTKNPNENSSSDEENSNSIDINQSKINLNQSNLNTTFANFDRTNLYDTLIDMRNNTNKVNLTQLNETFSNFAKGNNLNRTKLHESLADFALKPGEVPLRNRRLKENKVLSKGQRKRMEKKEKVLKKKLLNEVLRKNKSLIVDNNTSGINKTFNKTTLSNLDYAKSKGKSGIDNNNHNKSNVEMSLERENKVNTLHSKEKKSEFDLVDLNSQLNNMISEIKEQDNNIKIEKNSLQLINRKKQNVKKLL